MQRSAIHRGILLGLCLAAGCLVAWLLDEHEHSPTELAGGAWLSKAEAADAPRPATLDDLCQGRLKIVDLGWPINKDNLFWPGPQYHPFDLQTIATLDKDGVLSKAYSTPEHLGTHLDAPNHFEAQGISVDQLQPANLFSPAVLIDVTGPAALDADYRLRLEDLLQWEQAHGRVPPGAVVLLYTGWQRHWGHKERYQGVDVTGRLHFPGYSAAAVKFLLEERGIRGVGLDTLSVDYGLSRDFEVHHLLGKAGRYGLENLAHLDQLPSRGFYLGVAPIKLESGTGGQARVFAILPQQP